MSASRPDESLYSQCLVLTRLLDARSASRPDESQCLVLTRLLDALDAVERAEIAEIAEVLDALDAMEQEQRAGCTTPPNDGSDR